MDPVTSKMMPNIFIKWHIKHITGISYNPEGQEIVERNHQCLKEQLVKQKGGTIPHIQLQIVTFAINSLYFSKVATEYRFQKHWGQLNSRLQVKVRWKDPLTTQWRGPDTLITMDRGFGCIFPIGRQPQLCYWLEILISCPFPLSRKIPKHKLTNKEKNDYGGHSLFLKRGEPKR